MISLFSLSVPLPYHRYWQSVTGARVCSRDISSPSREMTTKHIAPANLRWLKTSEVCDLLGITDETLSKWRMRGCAPDFIRLPNGDLRYSQVAVDLILTDPPYALGKDFEE